MASATGWAIPNQCAQYRDTTMLRCKWAQECTWNIPVPLQKGLSHVQLWE